jgi:hypothetical protein
VEITEQTDCDVAAIWLCALEKTLH